MSSAPFPPNTVKEYKHQAERNLAIDALRGLAVILMLEQHLGFWLWDKGAISASSILDYPIIISINALGGLAAPLFLAISGFGSVYFLEKLQGRQSPVMLRGVVIILFGYLLNLVVSSWFSIGSWYVLHVIGFCLVLSVFLNRVSTLKLIISIPLIIFITVLLQMFLETPSYMGNTRMGDYSMPGGVFRLVFAEGHFPVFPWISFFICGMIAARWNMSGETKKMLKLSIALITAGLVISIPGFILPDVMKTQFGRVFIFIPNFYPAAPPITFLLMGISLSGIFGAVRVLEKAKLTDSNFFVNLGRVSMTILFLHAVIFREIFQLFGFRNIFNQLETLLLIAFIILAFGFIAIIWRNLCFKYSLEWLMRKSVG